MPERGVVGKFTHANGDSVAVSAVIGYYVSDGAGGWELTDTPPAEGYVAYRYGEEVIAADNPQTARIALIGASQTAVVRNIPTDIDALGALTFSRAGAATYLYDENPLTLGALTFTRAGTANYLELS